MKKILLIAPKSSQLKHIKRMENRFFKQKNIMLPLSIATIAALTPDDVEIDLWDEQVHGWIDEAKNLSNYDLVGITGYIAHIPRAKEIARIFRNLGIPVAIGGLGVSSIPEYCRNDFDILFVGEAELTWPKFIVDWKAGHYRKVYRQITKPELTMSPLPLWDCISNQVKHYLFGAIQTTRGCPFDCEFCDVIYHFGRQIRQKRIDRVLEEIAAIEKLGMERIIICDDNFYANPRYTKELLREMSQLNKSFPRPLEYVTQLGIDVARDEEALELLADANFHTLFIGIETPNKESLKEVNKHINLSSNLINDCLKVQSYGLFIHAGLILGFDHDTSEIFDSQFDFIQETGIPIISTALLQALPGTKLWHRLKKEGRVLKPDEKILELVFATTNIIPKCISRIELLSSSPRFLEKVYDWKNFVKRVKKMISSLKYKPKSQRKNWKELFRILKIIPFLDKDGRSATLSILLFMIKYARFMIQKLYILIIQQYDRLSMLRFFREEYPKLIEMEKSIHMEKYTDRSGLILTEDFIEAYYEIFPDIQNRIYRSLKEKTRISEVLIKVFTEFLIRKGRSLNKLSEQDRFLIQNLADQAAVKENNSVEVQFPASTKNYVNSVDIKNTKLSEEILKFVEQELR